MRKALFVGGTASHVGKTWFTAALCRVLKRRGIRVAPFKAQNMSNNAYPCVEGGEIGRAQAMQAEACGVPPMADMNPVLLKPNSATGSQVVVQGKVWGDVSAREYYGLSAKLFGLAVESFERLAAQFDVVVCEGAGSVAEVNLLARDITNLRLAERVGAAAILVADIERGGVFGSLVGTMELLPESQRRLVKAFAVNRFRGDVTLFDDGVKFLEKRLGIPCLGVFPWAEGVELDEEDSLGIPAGGSDEVAVVKLPRIANFTDFRTVGPVDWVERPGGKQYRVVFLPGTKNTVEDLAWMRAVGLDGWVRQQWEGGALVVGICGGYQILGETVDGVAGLGMLPVRTVMQPWKVTRGVAARTEGGIDFEGYEIHMGETERAGGACFYLADGRAEGCRVGRVRGTYLHGAFDTGAVIRELFGLERVAANREAMYDAVADWLEVNARRDVLEGLLA